MALNQILQLLSQQGQSTPRQPRIAPRGVRPPFAKDAIMGKTPNIPLRAENAPPSDMKGNWMQMLGASLPVMLPESQADGMLNVMPGSMPKAEVPQPRMAPTLNNKGSNDLLEKALALLSQANAEPLPQAGKGPNLESIGLALLPALLGADPSYIGKAAGGYMAGQEQELGRRNAERENRINQAKLQAQGLQTQAGAMQDAENTIFSQESQNFRNEQDNERMLQTAEMIDARTRDINSLRLQNQSNIRYVTEMSKRIASMFGDADGWTAEDDKTIRDEIRILADFMQEDADALIATLVGHKVGDMSVQAQNSAQNQMKAVLGAAGSAYKTWLGTLSKRNAITDKDVKDMQTWVASLPKDAQIYFPIPTAGETTQAYLGRARVAETARHNKEMEAQGVVRNQIGQQNADTRTDIANKPTATRAPKGSGMDFDKAIQSVQNEIAEIQGKIQYSKDNGYTDDVAKLEADLAGKKAVLKSLESQKKTVVETPVASSGDIQSAIQAGKAMVAKCGDTASCANFASGMLQSLGANVPTIAGAKKLIDTVARMGEGIISKDKAKPGDLVYLYGRQYGAAKDSKGNGYHVGVYLGDGRMADSSNRVTRNSRTVPSGAMFVHVPTGSAKPPSGGGAMIGAMSGLGTTKASTKSPAKNKPVSVAQNAGKQASAKNPVPTTGKEKLGPPKPTRVTPSGSKFKKA